ncbi:hypothetical protein RJD24_14890 [Bacillaceae bacterium IKA-2]|nr:hypothetical protein RJD24_14890 [Bacillaceae bacterium IKA-2]
MAKKINVRKIQTDDREVIVFVDDQLLLVNKKVEPEGRMLADSDHLSFLYILNVEEDFIYVNFPKNVWADLNIALQNKLPIFLQIDIDTRVPLILFHEELEYFIGNIRENSNYGESMVQAVSQCFII